ncbi:MAG: hypothetical protein KA797_04685 [Chitinophagales bacterium]|nr:hypothetical protein [Chitinophagales bacterium]
MMNAIQPQILSMRKGTSRFLKICMLMLTIGYVAMPEYCSAANIIVKPVKIKKKNPKIGNGGNGINTAFNNFDIDAMTITLTPAEGAKAAGMVDYQFAFAVAIKNSDVVKNAALSFTSYYFDGKTAAQRLIPVYNKEKGLYTTNLRDRAFQFEGDKRAIENFISLVNEKGDTVFFDAKFEKDSNSSVTTVTIIQFKNNKPKQETTTLGEISALASLKKMTVQTTPDIFESGLVHYLFAFNVDTKTEGIIRSVNLSFMAKDANGKEELISLNPVLNKESGQYETYLGTKKYPSEDSYSSFRITIVGTKGDTAFFVSEIEKIKNAEDPCKTKFKLKEVFSEETTQSGIYGVGFYFSFEGNSDAPSAVDMIVQITNCNGETKNLRVKLNQSNGVYVGGFAMPQDKVCPWKLNYGEVYATNPCGEMTWWGLEFGQIKTDGAGTRSTTTTTKSARPQLQ